ncbi:hypothetical protein [Citreimonas salinaria]|uniref:Uncharacterized protein n=1 Tax=Citreimonas salinaria TaxID=321339 RepID=A0A1H3KSK6_9RHOB|nr:hypothetical protein [Citreimonas salinaria]SDY55006.1 hypothetical protein SAMN05444340_11078 [Citreimonas salinaria]
MKKPRFHVTDHALLRYFERAQGIDVEALRCSLGRRIDAACEGHKGMNGVVIEGMRFHLEGETVVTAWEHNQPLRGRGRRMPRVEVDE